MKNLEFDHGDIFDDLAAIERQFHHFVRTIPRSGLIVANGADEALERVLTMGTWTPVEKIGVPTEWSAGAADSEGGFEVAWQGEPVGRSRWTLLGLPHPPNAPVFL